jgi:hypothetical protein
MSPTGTDSGSLGESVSARRSAAIVALVAAIAYSSSFLVPFQFDDRVVLVGEPAITAFELDPGSLRFVGDLSFAISYRLFGDRPAGYHAVNLAIHVANALLVFWLVRLLLRTEPMRRNQRPDAGARIALLAGLLFVAHPLQTQAVTYVVQRYASLAATFFLLAICGYVRFRLASARRESIRWYALFVASAGAAMWTKENAFVLPVAAALVELLFFSAPVRRRLAFFSPFLLGAAAAIGFALASGVTLDRLDAATRVGTNMPRWTTSSDPGGRELPPPPRDPIGQNIDHDVSISHSLMEPGVLLAAAIHAALLLAASLAIVRGFRGDAVWRLVGFGISWFYVTLLVESSFIPIVDVMYEHRAYLPSAGFFVACAVLLTRVPFLSEPPRVDGGDGRARDRARPDVRAQPRVAERPRAVDRRGVEIAEQGAPLNNVGVALFNRGDALGAIAMYERAIRADPGYTKAYFNIGEALQKVGSCRGDSRLSTSSAVTQYPDTYRNLAGATSRPGSLTLRAVLRDAYQLVRRRAGATLPPSR